MERSRPGPVARDTGFANKTVPQQLEGAPALAHCATAWSSMAVRYAAPGGDISHQRSPGCSDVRRGTLFAQSCTGCQPLEAVPGPRRNGLLARLKTDIRLPILQPIAIDYNPIVLIALFAATPGMPHAVRFKGIATGMILSLLQIAHIYCISFLFIWDYVDFRRRPERSGKAEDRAPFARWRAAFLPVSHQIRPTGLNLVYC